MADLLKTLDEAIDGFESRKGEHSPYYYFEPWDCDMPDEETIAAAFEDGIDLEDDPAVKLSGEYPRPFQSGSILSTKEMVCTQAGSRSGKTICSLVVIGAMISHKPPYAFRFPKGVDTGIKRVVSVENIVRFGRFDKRTGAIIDHDTKALKTKQDGTWDCGSIEGAGVFPEKLYCPPGRQIWIGTVSKSVDTLWWPSLTGTGESRFLPPEFIDTTKGNKGSDKSRGIVHVINDIDIHLKTYDMGHVKFESETCWLLNWDEEPPKPDIYVSGAVHAKFQRFSFTPLMGRSWSEELFFSCLGNRAGSEGRIRAGKGLRRSDFDYFYASQFDSPFVERRKLQRDRRGMELWQRQARVWGQYSEYAGQPFFNREKIHYWAKHFVHTHTPARLRPSRGFSGMHGSVAYNQPGILGVRVLAEPAADDDKEVWHIYEKPRKGVGYIGIFDSAEGAVDPQDAKDWNFGLIARLPDEGREDEPDGLPITVATLRSTLPTVAFARVALLGLRYYNNALLAAERGVGKDNEAFGLTLEDWPWWYVYIPSDAKKRSSPRKGFSTNRTTRSACLSLLRDWTDSFEATEDPYIRDAHVYKELAGAISKETVGGKLKCDHTRDGSLDGVICLAIGTYILHETPDVVVCNASDDEGADREGGFLRRMWGSQKPPEAANTRKVFGRV